MTKLVVVDAEELRRMIKEAVADALLTGPAADEWVDARSSGLGRRTFLRLARDGSIPVSKIGKRYVARRADVVTYVEQQRLRERSAARPSGSSPSRKSRARTPTERETLPADVDDPVARALAQGRLRILKRS